MLHKRLRGFPRRGSRAMGDPRAASPLLHFDPDNFNSKEARNCPHVLTSPCARLGERPVELLHRSLSQFVRAHRDAPLDSVALLYEVYERERRRRAERRKVTEEAQGALETVPEHAAESQGSKPCSEDAARDETPREAERRPGEPGTRGRSLSVRPADQQLLRVERRGPNSHDRTATSVSLGDLRHSAATSRELERLARDIRKETSVAVPQKDRKIAALMLARREDEESRLRRSQRDEELREEARRHETLERAAAERRRRKELERGAVRWHEALEVRRRQREQEEVQLAALREQERVAHEERWDRLAEEQAERRRERAQVARREAEERKRSQERLLEELERRERAGRQQEVRLALDRELHAGRSRRARERGERRQRRLHNQQQQLRYLLLKREREEEARALELRRRSALERRLQRSRENHARLMEARQQELRERGARGEELKQRARERAGRQSRQLEQQRNVLAELGQQRMERAAQRVREQSRERAQVARRLNAERERAHRLLRERLVEEEQGLLRQRLGHIARTERRREQLQCARQEALEEARTVARASFHMRERVKGESRSPTFHQMALEAQITAALGRLEL
ncbi:coiled-coil domain-containing protein 177-like [Arapaima gigas]